MQKPIRVPRTLKEARGPYARLELHTPTPRWKIALLDALHAVAYVAAMLVAGALVGGLLAIVEVL